MKILTASLLILLVCLQLHAQTLPLARNYEAAYKKQTRSANGRPGKSYWQNTAGYNIAVRFNPSTRLVSGSEDIVYFNNSPDTLNEIIFKLYPNFYKKGSQRDSPVDTADLSDGVHITSLSVNGASREIHEPEGTNMRLHPVKLMPGEKMNFHLDFSYLLNKTSHQRTGMVDDSSAFIAYFFPRIAVYDDIDGWNRIPYTGQVEMYNDFCSFNVSITVPGNYLVCATGDLLNANEVYAPAIAQRISAAEKNDGITKVIDTGDLKNGSITAQDPTNTWKFKADSVTDFVFATSNHYAWYASSLVVDKATQRRVRVDAVFNPAHKDYFNVIDYARKTVESMSYNFPAWPFPYPHETIFDGLDQMEYPMMVNDNPLDDKADEIELTDHEIFHTMFPFYMGINETKYAWMDEGWASIGEWLISPMIDSSVEDDYGMGAYNHSAGYDFDAPITSLSTQQNGASYFLNAYAKPAMGYLYIKDMLGDELFTKALHYYMEQWHGKHPMPLDFFNCMNAGSGKNLNWFWQQWFYDEGYPDLAIMNVKQSGGNITVTVVMKGNKPVPVHLTVYYKDGTTEALHQSMAVWEKSNETAVSFTSGKKIKKIVLGGVHDADTDKTNNVWQPE
ncbi:M1 family metallopeptidase [Parafilimonas sp.]|uniref:M1 family metallopeptidase n=1 Tax=Parafilimonas sp. TaxID=1969739 RepID=UPI0039E29A35